jgi:uncharacterized membrane protein YeiH
MVTPLHRTHTPASGTPDRVRLPPSHPNALQEERTTPMATTVLLILDLAGTFAFALNGALTAVRATRLDIVGVVTLGMITALGGGTIRDVFLDSLPPATFLDWRYLAVAAVGGLVAFFGARHLERINGTINVLDAAGLSLFAITGALKAVALGFGPAQAVIVGTITGVGGGTLRDVLVRQVPSVLTGGLYAIPALIGATAVVVAGLLDASGPVTAVGAAVLCFVIRMLGVHFDVNAPFPPGTRGPRPQDG